MFEALPGFREFYPEDFSRRLGLFDSWRRSLEICGFSEYDAAVLEPLDLYKEKSGEEIVEQLFHFVDKGDRKVALRPEMTPTLARMIGAKANALRRPVKWFNIGDHFRYERMQKGRTRCFTQLNVDILGDAGVTADVEAIYSLILVCKRLGLTGEQFVIRLSDRDIWLLALETANVQEDLRPQVLGVIDKVERMSDEQSIEALEKLIPGRSKELFDVIQSMFAIENLDGLKSWFDGRENVAEEIRERIASRLEEWRDLWEQLNKLGCGEFLKLDFTIVRGLAYYTGFVFEAFEKGRRARALAGGGRYDHLIEKLGGPDFPAVGWAMGDVTMTDCLDHHGLLPSHETPIRVFAVMEDESRETAMKIVAKLRESGVSMVYSHKKAGFGKQLKEATQWNCQYALVMGSSEMAIGKVLVRNLEDRAEESIGINYLVQHFKKLGLAV